MLFFIFIPKKKDDNILVFFIITLKERGDIIFIFLNTAILITNTIITFMVVIISKILMVGEEKQGWH